MENINIHFEFDEVNFGDDLHLSDTGLLGLAVKV